MITTSILYPNLNEVQGQAGAKRSLLVAEAGAHTRLMLYNIAP